MITNSMRSRPAKSAQTSATPVEVVLRRFFREIQQSELMTEIKRRRYFEKKPTRFKRRQSALTRAVRRRTKRGY